MPSVVSAKEPAPEDRTYFIQVMGLQEDPFAVEADCLTFSATEACTLGGQTCLSWQRVQEGLQSRQQSGFSLSATLDDDGLLIALSAQGRVDTRGSKSSISAAGAATALDLKMNFAFSGRQVSRGRCRQLVEELQSSSSGS